MRQLRATGFLHNRVRMIVAMFLTKDLHISWKAGEQWFSQRLVDSEIASNNGGWQWSASTGTDAAPYFRMQNPWTQAKRFDPDGEYIQRWVPELRAVRSNRLFAPPRRANRSLPAIRGRSSITPTSVRSRWRCSAAMQPLRADNRKDAKSAKVGERIERGTLPGSSFRCMENASTPLPVQAPILAGL
jgi:hypothetical protein